MCSSTHSEAPYGVVLPVEHAWQASDPAVELYRPATQSVQVSVAEVDEYFPAGQIAQLIAPEKPMYEPGLQSSQAALVVPLDGLCWPAGHE